MITTIISNNCTGGAVCHELGMEFKSPTINLQILPEDYPRFCANIEYRDIMLNKVFQPGDRASMPYERAMELIDKGFVTKKDKKG